MSIKKLLVFMFLFGIGGASYSADFSSFIDNKEIKDLVQTKIENTLEGQTYRYNYDPIVFTMVTTFKRDLFVEDYDVDGRPFKIDMNYLQQGLSDEGMGLFESNCYATLINKDYMLTHSSCLYIPTQTYKEEKLEGVSGDFTPISVAIRKDGRELIFNPRKLNTVFFDNKSGIALIKISDLCLQEKPTKASNVCVRLWEWAVGSEDVFFKIEDKYNTMILSNMDPQDDVEESFLRRSFFSPVSGKKTIKSVKDGYITVDGEEDKSYLGEPLFHRVSWDKNILVGIKTSDSLCRKATYSGKYSLFSSEFTDTVKEKIKKGGVKLTKDLNGNTSL